MVRTHAVFFSKLHALATIQSIHASNAENITPNTHLVRRLSVAIGRHSTAIMALFERENENGVGSHTVVVLIDNMYRILLIK